jgi:hypothetical protein
MGNPRRLCTHRPRQGILNVYERFVCPKSKVFEAACRKEWLEKRQVPLPDVEPRLFKVHFHWVFEGIAGLPALLLSVKVSSVGCHELSAESMSTSPANDMCKKERASEYYGLLGLLGFLSETNKCLSVQGYSIEKPGDNCVRSYDLMGNVGQC